MWILGTGLEPSGPIAGSCPSAEQFFVALEQSGDELIFKRPRRCGAPDRERATGKLIENEANLKGEGDPFAPEAAPVNYQLRYNPTTRHFTGTRDGVPVWLARQGGFCDQWVRGGCATIVSGRVADAQGRSIPQVRVRVRSMNPSQPFDSTVDVVNGAYRVSDVPAEVTVEISVVLSDRVLARRVMLLMYIDDSVTLPANIVDFVDVTP
jgi:hypothetical protein